MLQPRQRTDKQNLLDSTLTEATVAPLVMTSRYWFMVFKEMVSPRLFKQPDSLSVGESFLKVLLGDFYFGK